MDCSTRSLYGRDLRNRHLKDIADNTDWGVLMLFGGGLTLSAVLKDSGSSLVLGQTLANAFGDASPFLVIVIVAAFIIFLTEFTSNTASAALLVPVFAAIADQMGIPKEILVVVIGIGASCAFMLLSQHHRMRLYLVQGIFNKVK